MSYRLRVGGAPTLKYADLKRYFAERLATGETPSLSEVYEAVRSIRAAKGMLAENFRSAGSFFKNPIVEQAAIPRISALLGIAPTDIPHWPAGEGSANPAAWLIERAGFNKGFALGRAGISSKHTLALVNLGGATAADIIALRDAVMQGVEQRFAIRLEQEPVTLGFPPG